MGICVSEPTFSFIFVMLMGILNQGLRTDWHYCLLNYIFAVENIDYFIMSVYFALYF